MAQVYQANGPIYRQQTSEAAVRYETTEQGCGVLVGASRGLLANLAAANQEGDELAAALAQPPAHQRSPQPPAIAVLDHQ